MAEHAIKKSSTLIVLVLGALPDGWRRDVLNTGVPAMLFPTVTTGRIPLSREEDVVCHSGRHG